MERFAQQVGPTESALSGRLKIAQRFIAGLSGVRETKPVKRTAEEIRGSGGYDSAVRFTDYKSFSSFSPSSKLLGYYHSSALRTDKPTLWAKPQ
jgi:hypothetical protein